MNSVILNNENKALCKKITGWNWIELISAEYTPTFDSRNKDQKKLADEYDKAQQILKNNRKAYRIGL